MSKFISENFIKNYTLYRKLIYVFSILCIVLNIFINPEIPNNLLFVALVIFALFFVADTILYYLDYFGIPGFFNGFRYMELVVFSLIQGLFCNNPVLVGVILVIIIYDSAEFVLQGSDYDLVNLHAKKYLLGIPILINVVASFYNSENDGQWFTYLIMELMIYIIMNVIVCWFARLHEKHVRECNELYMEMSHMESNNAKLLEYQERVKTINEQINYQKFDLARANKELEQVNTEVKSQTEIMKYMASTFDILKCINVISDAIMEVKAPKFCAMYVSKDVYMNETGNCIIKTNYSSMQRRLKKDIENIYDRISKGTTEPQIFAGEDLKKCTFIGDANINVVALLPFVDNNKIYGMMIVGSNETDFFSKGLGYYENCIVEFNVTVNRTRLYLKMQDMARKDGLTGIYNRIYFKELFAKAVQDIKRKKKPISVALYDIDKFKNVNDTYGHIAGDRVIQMVASMGKKYAEANNGFSCRYGGEEFLLVLPGFDENEAIPVLERLHSDIINTVVTSDDVDIHVNVCIGLTSYPNLCSDTNLLVSRADKAMYYGKKNGRGRLVVDSEMIDIDD